MVVYILQDHQQLILKDRICRGNRGAFHVILLGKKFNRIRLHLLTGCIIYVKFTSPTLVKLTFDIYDVTESNWALNVKSERVFRDESVWHHIVLTGQ